MKKTTLALSQLIADTQKAMPSTPDFPHISFTQLGMFTRCSMQYYFRYIEGLKQPPALPMAIGKGGHAALETNGRHKIATSSDLPLPDLLDVGSTAIDLETQNIEDATKKEVGEAKDRALANLTVYHHEVAPQTTPIGVEVEFNLDLNEPDKYPIRIMNGKVDLLAEDPLLTHRHADSLRVTVDDYKWVNRKKPQAEADITKQFDTYLLFVKTLTGKYATRARFIQMTPGNTKESPGVTILERDSGLMTPKAQERRFARLRASARAMEIAIANNVFVPVDNPMTCAWCGYRDRCQQSLVNDYEARELRLQSDKLA